MFTATINLVKAAFGMPKDGSLLIKSLESVSATETSFKMMLTLCEK